MAFVLREGGSGKRSRVKLWWGYKSTLVTGVGPFETASSVRLAKMEPGMPQTPVIGRDECFRANVVLPRASESETNET